MNQIVNEAAKIIKELLPQNQMYLLTLARVAKTSEDAAKKNYCSQTCKNQKPA